MEQSPHGVRGVEANMGMRFDEIGFLAVPIPREDTANVWCLRNDGSSGLQDSVNLHHVLPGKWQVLEHIEQRNHLERLVRKFCLGQRTFNNLYPSLSSVLYSPLRDLESERLPTML